MSSLTRPALLSTRYVRAFSSTANRAYLNKIQLIGRIGADPVVTEFKEGKNVVNYTVATSETRPDAEGNIIRRTQWHRITSWNSADWLPAKFKKGDLVYVEGILRYTDFTDKEGILRTKAEITQSSAKLLNPSRQHDEDEGEN
ncbi:hypothetical protein BX666DRAFT_104590 [Dichotomocladium elegans]|nr:hypothetical protein BX666DRAFT_104590 [Dichotomocladium elegans]